MKGIILAGGSGTRLYPLTLAICKQLLPIYDKPLIYYPLSTLMLAGIRDILIISTPHDIPIFEQIFGNGSQLGLNISYKVQLAPKGIAEAFILGEEFIGDDDVSLVLGDNIFYGQGLSKMLQNAAARKDCCSVFGYYVSDPERYGVVEFDDKKRVISLEEKPKSPRSNYAVVGLYFYLNSVVEVAKRLKPSSRGELEITDVNNVYLCQGLLNVELFGRGYAWLDTGTHESIAEAGEFIKTIERRQGLKIACIEEIAFRMGYIGDQQMRQLAAPLMKSGYGRYLLNVLEGK